MVILPLVGVQNRLITDNMWLEVIIMDQKKIGLFISKRRKDKKLTQKELGERLSVSDKSVSKWERGICMPDSSLYIPLCDILQIDVKELLMGESMNDSKSQKFPFPFSINRRTKIWICALIGIVVFTYSLWDTTPNVRNVKREIYTSQTNYSKEDINEAMDAVIDHFCSYDYFRDCTLTDLWYEGDILEEDELSEHLGVDKALRIDSSFKAGIKSDKDFGMFSTQQFDWWVIYDEDLGCWQVIDGGHG